MKKIFSFKGYDLHLRLSLKFFSLFALTATSCFCLKAEESKQLHIALADGTAHQILLKGEIVMTPIEDDILDIQSEAGAYQLPLLHIKKFHLEDNSSVDGIWTDNSEEWSIFTINGMFVKSGEGSPDLSSLNSGEVYIVRQGTLTYKFIAR